MIEPVPLSLDTLGRLPAGIVRPAFNPRTVSVGIVHLGLGGFHRAHMARYTHDLMGIRADCLSWGISGAGLLPADKRIRDALMPQDALYTLVERQDERELATVIGSIKDVIFAGRSSRALLDMMSNRQVRIVSLTVTSHGYCLNPATKQLDPVHPSILHDLAHPELPCSAIGVLVESFRRRLDIGVPPFTVLTCDNILHNGMVLRGAVLAFAHLRDPRLAARIEAFASFPNTMVDRITPATTYDDISYLADRFGVADRLPVFSELFTQWVIEDSFVQGRPPWEEVGAQFVRDVAPYEFMKLRLLNASHLAVAGIGRLAGYAYIDEALRDRDIHAYMQVLMDRETGPTVPPVPGVDLVAYQAKLLERFANTKIKDTVDRVNSDAPVNLLIDPILDRLKTGAGVDLLSLALAAWMRRLRGEDEMGRPIEVLHPLADQLRVRALEGGADPRPLLSLTSLFGELIEHQPFVSALEGWLALFYGVGAKATLAWARQTLRF